MNIYIHTYILAVGLTHCLITFFKFSANSHRFTAESPEGVKLGYGNANLYTYYTIDNLSQSGEILTNAKY